MNWAPTRLCCFWFNKKNGVHRPGGEHQASGEENRGEYLSRKGGPWKSLARITIIGSGKPRQLVFPDWEDSHQLWMIGNLCQVTSQYELNLWRGTMHGDEERVIRKSIKPKLSVVLSLKARSENCQRHILCVCVWCIEYRNDVRLLLTEHTIARKGISLQEWRYIRFLHAIEICNYRSWRGFVLRSSYIYSVTFGGEEQSQTRSRGEHKIVQKRQCKSLSEH